MRTKYKYKYQKEKTNQNHFLSEENLSPDENTKNRIIVNTKKKFKKFSLENTAKKDENQKKSKFVNNKETNFKSNININIENKNSISESNRIQTYYNRNKIDSPNNLLTQNNKNDIPKKNIFMKIYSEEKRIINNNLIKSPSKEKNNSIYKAYGNNKNCNLGNNIIKYNTNDKRSYSIRNNSIRNYYKNISYEDRSNIEKKIEENNYNRTKLYKRKYFEEIKNKNENEKEKEIKNNEINNKEKNKDEANNKEINKNETNNKEVNNNGINKIEINNNEVNIKEIYNKEINNKETKNNETINKNIKNEKKKYNKIKELNNIQTKVNLELNNKKEIQVKRINNNYYKNRTKTLTNFNFLIHEAHENHRINSIFNKLYDSTPNITQVGESKSKINLINNIIINNDNNKSDISSLYNKTNNNITENNSKIKSMKSVYSILKSHSRNNISDKNHSSQNIIKDYKNIRNYSREQKINNYKNPREKNESVDITNDEKTTIKSNLSSFQYLSNCSDINNSNDKLNYFFKKNYEFPQFKIICKNNKLKNFFKKNNIEFNEKNNEIKVENQIINNNTYNTTYNIFKINDKITKQNQINIELETEDNKSEFQLNSSNDNNNANQITSLLRNKKIENNKYIDFEIIFILEEKLKTIINKVNKYEICNDECFDWIRFYFYNEFFDKEINIFQNSNNKTNIINIIKEEIICFFLCYEVSFSQNFNRISILLKAIFQLLHMNYLLLVSYILDNNYAKIKLDENDLVNQIINIINKELKISINFKENITEDNILQKINDNLKQIYNYYLMIIDNIYTYKESNLIFNIYSFPNCINLDINKITNIQKNNIIILFFYESIKTKQNYTIQDLKKFFNLFLNKAKITFSSFFNIDNNSPKNINNKNNTNNIINYDTNNYQNYIRPLKVNQNKTLLQNQPYLPPIQYPYTYTLVLDLDETLIHYKTEISKNLDNPKKTMLILRPDLILFLKEMKKIYELVLFSYATYEYIEKVLKIIESKEKFFDYILDRRHITYENGSYIKNLSLIGRDLKNVIIVDDKPQAFKMHKENGIFIKPFYGDCLNNKNLLKNLIDILKDIRKDVETSGDIRKSIQKKNHDIFTKITTGLIG